MDARPATTALRELFKFLVKIAREERARSSPYISNRPIADRVSAETFTGSRSQILVEKSPL
jgi:hypothetical protein